MNFTLILQSAIALIMAVTTVDLIRDVPVLMGLRGLSATLTKLITAVILIIILFFLFNVL